MSCSLNIVVAYFRYCCFVVVLVFCHNLEGVYQFSPKYISSIVVAVVVLVLWHYDCHVVKLNLFSFLSFFCCYFHSFHLFLLLVFIVVEACFVESAYVSICLGTERVYVQYHWGFSQKKNKTEFELNYYILEHIYLNTQYGIVWLIVLIFMAHI